MRFTGLALIVALSAVLAGCQAAPPGTIPSRAGVVFPADLDIAMIRFLSVVENVEPVAERECQRRARGVNCDFLIAVDSDPDAPSNAFQTEINGRPYIVFTAGLIGEARNRDELALILGHEAAHHIEGHIDRRRSDALAVAKLAGYLADIGGADEVGVAEAQRRGAFIGARAHSKEAELEADALGTIIAHRAGYDPLLGARFFTRIPDPGNVFLGTHPPNSERIRRVSETYALIR